MSRKKKQVKKTTTPPLRAAAGVYLLVMFMLFPVFCTDGFFHIRHDRYHFFLAASGTFAVIMGLLWILGERKNYAPKKPGSLSVTDWSMLAFVLCCAVSTGCSAHFKDALWGTAGRNNGLLLMAVYVAVYFLISRFDGRFAVVYGGFALAAAFVSLVAVLNFFCLDPLSMVSRLQPKDQGIFISTIGNKNLLSSYLCIGLPVVMGLFLQTPGKKLRWFSFGAACLGFAALMTADSDSGLLGFLVLTAVLLIWAAPEPGRLKKLLILLTAMVLSGQLLYWLTLLLPGENRGMGGLQKLILAGPASVVRTLCLMAAVALHFLQRKKPELRMPWLRWVFVALFGASAAAVIFGMVWFTRLHPEVPLEGPMTLLRLNYTWGTNRGFMWIKSLELFADASWKDKLFGTGPDTFYYAFQPYFAEMSTFGNSSTNAAHNEYLNYLITLGVLGLGAYLTAVVSAVVRGIRKIGKDPMILVCLGAVVCYSAQALVNIAQPITTPLFILFVALCAMNNKEHA